jgi:hypothetical protein
VLRTLAIVLGLLVLVALAVVEWQIGLSNVWGMLRYDQRREGDYFVGDQAPDVVLGTLDGQEIRLLDGIAERPLVLIFGSYT